MKDLRSINTTAGVAIIPCQAGKTIRILGFNAAVTVAANGGQVNAAFTYREQIVAISATEPLTVAIGTVSGFIGASSTGAMVLSTDPVTGVNTFSQDPTVSTMALPDLEFLEEVRVTLSGDQATVDSATVIYELTQ